ncbi:class I SAM-dependent methyltransferase [bacterium]|nr:class I SAM-dependent methyltransferase [bacterium]
MVKTDALHAFKMMSPFKSGLPVRYWGHRFLDIPVLLNWTKISRGSSVLEVGCGQGDLSHHLSKRLKCKHYTAIDNDPKMVARADSKTKSNNSIIFQVAQAENLPFEKNSFDLVMIMDLLHHLPDWKKAIREAHRVLKDGGKLWIRDYSIETFALPGLGMVLQKVLEHPYDMMFDQIELLTYLKKNGFTVTHQNDATWMIILSATKNGKKK